MAKKEYALELNNDLYPVIKCPICGSEWSHHGMVECYERDTEDSLTGVSIKINPELGVLVGRHMDGNPSGRRNGIKIQIEGESCGHIFYLIVAQHKGQTRVYVEANNE